MLIKLRQPVGSSAEAAMKKRTIVLAAATLLTVGFVLGVYEITRVWKLTRALQAMGPADAAEVPRIVALLEDYDPLVRQEAALALAHIGPPAQAATPALLRALKDRSAPMRSHA